MITARELKIRDYTTYGLADVVDYSAPSLVGPGLTLIPETFLGNLRISEYGVLYCSHESQDIKGLVSCAGDDKRLAFSELSP